MKQAAKIDLSKTLKALHATIKDYNKGKELASRVRDNAEHLAVWVYKAYVDRYNAGKITQTLCFQDSGAYFSKVLGIHPKTFDCRMLTLQEAQIAWTIKDTPHGQKLRKQGALNTQIIVSDKILVYEDPKPAKEAITTVKN